MANILNFFSSNRSPCFCESGCKDTALFLPSKFYRLFICFFFEVFLSCGPPFYLSVPKPFSGPFPYLLSRFPIAALPSCKELPFFEAAKITVLFPSFQIKNQLIFYFFSLLFCHQKNVIIEMGCKYSFVFRVCKLNVKINSMFLSHCWQLTH